MALLEMQNVSVSFRTEYGRVQAITDASLTLETGETLVIIGESGSGKTVLVQTLLRLLPKNVDVSGRVVLSGISLLDCSEKELQQIRGKRVVLIPQSAATALNPVRRVGSLLLEFAQAQGIPRRQARQRLTTLLHEFGLDFDTVARSYPHQLSGGMQQRFVNAAAMIGNPDLVIADEPTFGLDADMVAATATQLRAITERGAGLIVITHDLRLAERLGGRLAVIYGSYIVEIRATPSFFAQPAHPYSQALLNALPEHGSRPIPGYSPELTSLPIGCPFSPRCSERRAQCEQAVPDMYPLSDQSGAARCLLYA